MCQRLAEANDDVLDSASDPVYNLAMALRPFKEDIKAAIESGELEMALLQQLKRSGKWGPTHLIGCRRLKYITL